MADFKNLVSVYREKIKNHFLIFSQVSEVVNQITGLKIESQNLKIKDKIVSIKVKPKEKLLILINKDKIISQFKEQKIDLFDLK